MAFFKTVCRRTVIVTVVIALMSSMSTALAQAPRVKLHVFTKSDPSGLIDKGTEDRLKAVADAKKRLAVNRDIEIVERPELAQAVVEVTFIGSEASGQSASAIVPVGGVAVATPTTTTYSPVGRASLTSGTFKTELEASVGPFGRTYGENLARKVEDWIKKNGAALRSIPIGSAK